MNTLGEVKWIMRQVEKGSDELLAFREAVKFHIQLGVWVLKNFDWNEKVSEKSDEN